MTINISIIMFNKFETTFDVTIYKTGPCELMVFFTTLTLA